MLKKIKVRSLASNPWVMLVVAVAAAALLTFWVYRFLDSREAALKAKLAAELSRQKHVSVLVPVRDAAVGTVVDNNNFAARDVPADLVFDDVIRASDFDAVSNLKLVRAVARGRPVRRADLEALQARDFSDMLEVGKRALTIEIDAVNSADKMLKPGNHIDLYLISAAGSNASGSADDGRSAGKAARLLLSDLTVIATGQDVRARDLGEAYERRRANVQAGQPDDPTAYDSVTLSVTPEQAARISLAQKVGNLRAVLRNAADKRSTPQIVVQERSLFSDDADTDAVQYIVGNTHGKLISSLPNAPELPIGTNTTATSLRSDAALAASQKLAAAQQASMDRLTSALVGAGTVQQQGN
ncbi:MAG: Flp pilus assembly protein CpaB [Burkholderiaceae bacterium]|jgi:pilus assembly protein CpaB|nr:Flp pilus assembly protein CpaB [Burkholderiaceae bacterium]